MVQLLIIIALVALHTRDSVWAGEFAPWPGAPLNWPAWAIGVFVVGAMALCTLAGHVSCLRAGRKMDRSGSIGALVGAERAMLISRVFATLVFVASLYVTDWLGVVRGMVGDLIALDELLAITPLFACFVGGWASFHAIDRRLREAVLSRQFYDGSPVHPPPTRGQYVLGAIRHQLALFAVPMTLITAWQEFVSRVAASHSSSAPSSQSTWVVVLRLGGAIAMFALSPVILKKIWDTSPMSGGEFQEMLSRMCARYRVRMRTPLLWHTHGSLVNGAVLGLVWPFRYLLFTDALLERLSPRQVEAVAAHEIAHVRHRHILWLAMGVIGAVLSAGWLVEVAADALSLSGSPTISLGATTLLMLAGVFVFGFMSRRFEWQSDAFAVRHLSETIRVDHEPTPGSDMAPNASGPVAPVAALQDMASRESGDALVDQRVAVSAPAVAWMTSALRDVALINGVDPDRFSFRHGSISERIRRLNAIKGLPTRMLPIDRQARSIKWLAVVAFAVGIAGLIIEALAAEGR